MISFLSPPLFSRSFAFRTDASDISRSPNRSFTLYEVCGPSGWTFMRPHRSCMRTLAPRRTLPSPCAYKPSSRDAFTLENTVCSTRTKDWRLACRITIMTHCSEAYAAVYLPIPLCTWNVAVFVVVTVGRNFYRFLVYRLLYSELSRLCTSLWRHTFLFEETEYVFLRNRDVQVSER